MHEARSVCTKLIEQVTRESHAGELLRRRRRRRLRVEERRESDLLAAGRRRLRGGQRARARSGDGQELVVCGTVYHQSARLAEALPAKLATERLLLRVDVPAREHRGHIYSYV